MNSLTLVSPLVKEPPLVVRWAGSKARLAPILAPRLLEKLQYGGTYYEPFLGSAAVFLRLRSHGWRGRAVLSDILPHLVTFYKQLQDPRAAPQIGQLLQALGEGEGTNEKPDYYLKIREAFNKPSLDLFQAEQRTAWFLYMNHRCFNAVWRTNKQGEFNIAWGGVRKNPLPTRQELCEVGQALFGAELRHSDFADPLLMAGRGDVVYADPPYAGLHTSYAQEGFSDDDQRRLASALLSAVERGVFVIASNSCADLITTLYPDSHFTREKISIAHLVAGRAREKSTSEYLITSRSR